MPAVLLGCQLPVEIVLYNQSPSGPIDPTPTIAMVGILDRRDLITTQGFKDEGDAILLLGPIVEASDPLQGLGGSAYLQVVHGQKNGTPPVCDLEGGVQLVEGLRALIHGGGIKSAHDCSEGGLAVCIAEACFQSPVAVATPRMIGATIDLSSITGLRTDAILFGESHHRVVVSTSAIEAGKVIAQAKAVGLNALRLGTVGGTDLVLKLSDREHCLPVADLHDGWWNAIARLMG